MDYHEIQTIVSQISSTVVDCSNMRFIKVTFLDNYWMYYYKCDQIPAELMMSPSACVGHVLLYNFSMLM